MSKIFLVFAKLALVFRDEISQALSAVCTMKESPNLFRNKVISSVLEDVKVVFIVGQCISKSH